MIHLRVKDLGPVFDGQREATIEIDRARGTLSVRPLHRREVYSMSLAQVAEIVIWHKSARNIIRHRSARKERRP